MRVIGVQARAPVSSDFWRLGEPLLALNRAGHDCWLGRGRAMLARGMPDVIVTSRMATMGGSVNGVPLSVDEAAFLYHASRDNGPALVWDIDDDFWSIEDDNPYRLSNPQIAGFEAMGRGADVITVTTEALAATVRQHIVGPPVRVAPNLIDLGRFRWISKADDAPVVIGLQGGTHVRDWEMIARPLENVMALHRNVLLRVVGDRPVWLDRLPAERVMHRAFAPWDRWPDLLIGIDIGLAPLRPARFNFGRSPIKWMEYSAVGAATICSPTVYDRVVEHRVSGLIVETERQWTEALELLIGSTQIRHYLADNALLAVREKHAINRAADVWLPIFEEAKERHDESTRLSFWGRGANNPRSAPRGQSQRDAITHAV